jgi:hypothetical protein
MPIQVISLLILALLGPLQGLLWTPALADEAAGQMKSKPCFDFSKKPIPLPKKVTSLEDATLPRVSSKSGRMSANMFWGAARGQVGRPIQELIQEIAAHETMKSARVTGMAVIPQETQDFLIRQQVEYTVIPFMFVKIKWTEDWAFNLTQGSKEDPKEVQIFYQKTEGTAHIKHLCGTIVLNRLDPKITDVFIYEEAQATSRSEQDTVKGLIGTIRTFRYGRQD